MGQQVVSAFRLPAHEYLCLCVNMKSLHACTVPTVSLLSSVVCRCVNMKNMHACTVPTVSPHECGVSLCEYDEYACMYHPSPCTRVWGVNVKNGHMHSHGAESACKHGLLICPHSPHSATTAVPQIPGYRNAVCFSPPAPSFLRFFFRADRELAFCSYFSPLCVCLYDVMYVCMDGCTNVNVCARLNIFARVSLCGGGISFCLTCSDQQFRAGLGDLHRYVPDPHIATSSGVEGIHGGGAELHCRYPWRWCRIVAIGARNSATPSVHATVQGGLCAALPV